MTDRDAGERLSKEVLSASQAAELLGVSRQSLYEAAGRKEIPHRRIGKRFVFSRAALLAWVSCGFAEKVRQ
jgi:excisionase family DNA binding protein